MGDTGGLLCPIIDVAVTGIDAPCTNFAGSLCDLLAALAAGLRSCWVILEVVVSGPLASGTDSRLGTGVLWAPFTGHGLSDAAQMDVSTWRAPLARSTSRLERKTWVAAPIVAAWFVQPASPVTDAPYAVDALAGSPIGLSRLPLEDATPYFYAFGFAAWLVNGALSACLLA